jgi:hypothetical protein
VASINANSSTLYILPKVKENASRISQATIYTWKAKYGGLDVSEAQRLRSLEDENSRLKRLVADLSRDKEMLKAVIAKNGLT